MTIKRYSAGIQRAKGLLELAASLYDTSLSSQTRRAAEGVLQTDSRVGTALRLSLTVRTSDHGVSFSCATGGVREIVAVARGDISLAWVNPSVLLTMAYRARVRSANAILCARSRFFPPMTWSPSRFMNRPASRP